MSGGGQEKSDIFFKPMQPSGRFWGHRFRRALRKMKKHLLLLCVWAIVSACERLDPTHQTRIVNVSAFDFEQMVFKSNNPAYFPTISIGQIPRGNTSAYFKAEPNDIVLCRNIEVTVNGKKIFRQRAPCEMMDLVSTPHGKYTIRADIRNDSLRLEVVRD
ncbi:MAG: hypothetical protein MUD08_13385 [Cytophagales bacterium]|jgi:hypothetical protein|nr:hypothetical protein [Cytophagales bacterium]